MASSIPIKNDSFLNIPNCSLDATLPESVRAVEYTDCVYVKGKIPARILRDMALKNLMVKL